MLILTRKSGEAFFIGKNREIEIRVLSQGVPPYRNQIKIGINAPMDMPILREEILDKYADYKGENYHG